MRFRQKSIIEIEAIQYLGPFSYDEIVSEWGSEFEDNSSYDSSRLCPLELMTTDGMRRAFVGDWIVKYISGSFNILSPVIFKHTYEEIL